MSKAFASFQGGYSLPDWTGQFRRRLGEISIFGAGIPERMTAEA
jgi:hypothetical protein